MSIEGSGRTFPAADLLEWLGPLVLGEAETLMNFKRLSERGAIAL